jgi:hypothetical protein
MRAVGTRCVVCAAVIAACGMCVLPLQAGKKSEQTRAAAKLIADTLEREAKENVDRVALLKPAIEQIPNCEAARWLSGFVYEPKRKEWLQPDEIQKRAAENARLTEYRNVRAKHAENAGGQVDMARWCLRHRLDDQARAHYTHVLSFARDHQEARRQLGFVMINGEWVSQEAIADARQRILNWQDSLQRRAPELQNLLKRVDSSNLQARQLAQKELTSIKDPDLVPAIEAVLCSQGGEAALLGIQLMKGIKAKESAQSLAWQAAFSPWEPIQKAAASALKVQEKHDYVPLLLSSMRVPIQARYELYDMPDGSFFMRRAVYQEGPEKRQLAVTDLHRQGVVIHDSKNIVQGSALWADSTKRKQVERMAEEDKRRQQQSMIQARAKAVADIRQQQAAIATHNMTTAALNSRLCSVLEEATCDTSPKSAEDWYTWWNDYNEITNDGDKATYVSYRAYEKAVGSAANAPTVSGAIAPPPPPRECLVAGTPVWTELGPVPVEQIRVGDRVIACNYETGQLMLKPVLKTIVNPDKPTFRLTTAEHKLETTGGHLFWVAGEGWVRARQLRPQMRFHTLTGTVELTNVEAGERHDTFNLVVADFHAYFVGDDKILTHDNTVRKPTNCVVPGLATRAAAKPQ